MYCLNRERDLFCPSLSQTANTHKGEGQTCCRQSSWTMICAMSRKSSATTGDSNVKCLLTYLNCHSAQESAGNLCCSKLTMKDQTTNCTSSSLPTWTASNSQPSPQKYQPYSRSHLKGTQHLWKKTKPDKMLPNWPILGNFKWQVTAANPSGEHELLTAWCTVLHNRVKRESVICRNNMLKTKRKHQAEEVQRAVELSTNSGIREVPACHTNSWSLITNFALWKQKCL